MCVLCATAEGLQEGVSIEVSFLSLSHFPDLSLRLVAQMLCWHLAGQGQGQKLWPPQQLPFLAIATDQGTHVVVELGQDPTSSGNGITSGPRRRRFWPMAAAAARLMPAWSR